MLRTRLFLHLTPFVVILLAVGVYAIVQFARLASSVDAAVTNSYQSFTAASAMSLALAGMDREVSWVISGPRVSNKNALMEYRKHFETNLDLLLKASTLPGEMALTQQVVTNYQAFLKAVDTISSLGSPEKQRQAYEHDVVPSGQMMNLLLGKIHDLNHKAILGTSQNIREKTQKVTRLMIFGMVVALLISTFAVYQLGRSILEPIQLLTRATRELGEGRRDQPVPVTTRDELGNWPWRSTKWRPNSRNTAKAPRKKSSASIARWKRRSLRFRTRFLFWTRKDASN